VVLPTDPGFKMTNNLRPFLTFTEVDRGSPILGDDHPQQVSVIKIITLRNGWKFSGVIESSILVGAKYKLKIGN